MGHDIGISESYYKPAEKEVLEDYLKAVDLLTVNANSATLQKQVAHLSEKSEKENSKMQGIEDKHRQDIDVLREELRVEREKTNQIWDMIQNNHLLAHVKPDVLAKKKLQ